MRVAIVSDSIGPLDGVRAGSALARAWADEGWARCAVQASGSAGSTWLGGLAAAMGGDVELLPTRVDAPLALGVEQAGTLGVALEAAAPVPGIPAASSRPLGTAVAHALEAWPAARRLAVDLTWAQATHDAGAGLLAALGARADVDLAGGVAALAGITRLDLSPVRERLGDVELVGVVPAREVEQRLLGLRGISAGRGHAATLDLGETMAADDALSRYAALLDGDAATSPGAGACGGAALAILALGGRIQTGPAHLGALAGLDRMLDAADLVVVGCEAFDYLTRGGDVVTHVADACAARGVPVVVVADSVEIGSREMRTFGVEAAYPLGLAEPTDGALTAAARGIAASWHW